MRSQVSVLFNEPKLLKLTFPTGAKQKIEGFSALQRAEIAEMLAQYETEAATLSGFSALQRAEIAEMPRSDNRRPAADNVSVLFNEPKLLKSTRLLKKSFFCAGFSALQRAEIAEMPTTAREREIVIEKFQCSSTSRNC